jgi:hypothetical protein
LGLVMISIKIKFGYEWCINHYVQKFQIWQMC